jgi:phosphonate transport system ATP-binding protein
LHHLATARSYCERIVGMRAGRIVFCGPSHALTTEQALEVYGTEGDSEELKQALGEGPVQSDDVPASRAAVAFA